MEDGSAGQALGGQYGKHACDGARLACTMNVTPGGLPPWFRCHAWPPRATPRGRPAPVESSGHQAMNKAHVWRAALNRLRRDLTGAQVNAWLSGAHLAEVSSSAATLSVRSSYEKQLLETRYREMIERALTETLGAPVALTVTVGSSRHATQNAEKYQG